VAGGNLEVLQALHRRRRRGLGIVLHECDAGARVNHANLNEAEVLVEDELQHLARRVGRQALDEKQLVRWIGLALRSSAHSTLHCRVSSDDDIGMRFTAWITVGLEGRGVMSHDS
jgi:hypothetical protein